MSAKLEPRWRVAKEVTSDWHTLFTTEEYADDLAVAFRVASLVSHKGENRKVE